MNWMFASLGLQGLSRRTCLSLVLAAAVLTFLPDLRSDILPCHDSLQYQCNFQIFYSTLYHENDLPLWLPYGEYGLPSVTVLPFVTPAGYLVGFLGKILQITNALLLFKIAIMLELLIFVYGTFRLSELYFKRTESILLVCAGAILSFSWLANLDYTFHIFYMLPFVFRHQTSFLRSGSLAQLWIAGIFCVASCIGNLPYYAPLLALILCLYSLPQLRRVKLDFRRWDAIPFTLLCAGGMAYTGSFLLNTSRLVNLSFGRDPVTRKVLRDVFLNYGGVSKLPRLIGAQFTDLYTHGDVVFYVGLAPLILSVIAFFKCRQREFAGITIVTVFLYLFSFGGVTALLAYYFPGMAYYRHVGLVPGAGRFLLLIMGGFGLDALLEKNSGREAGWRYCDMMRVFLCAMIAMECLISLYGDPPPWGCVLFPESESARTTILHIGLRIGLYAATLIVLPSIFRKSMPGLSIASFILAAYLIDMGAFKIAIIGNWPPAEAQYMEVAGELFQARKLPWCATRKHPLELESTSKALNLLIYQGVTRRVPYAHYYTWVGLDPCISIYKTDFYTPEVTELFQKCGVPVGPYPNADWLPASNELLLSAIGCGSPKVKLGGEDAAGTVEITGFGANYIQANVHVTSTKPAFLYYADAFHPGWRATVNGENAVISHANIAFKAVPVPHGNSRVEFRFFNGLGSYCYYFLAFYSVALGIYFFAFYLRNGESGAFQPLQL